MVPDEKSRGVIMQGSGVHHFPEKAQFEEEEDSGFEVL